MKKIDMTTWSDEAVAKQFITDWCANLATTDDEAELKRRGLTDDALDDIRGRMPSEREIEAKDESEFDGIAAELTSDIVRMMRDVEKDLRDVAKEIHALEHMLNELKSLTERAQVESRIIRTELMRADGPIPTDVAQTALNVAGVARDLETIQENLTHKKYIAEGTRVFERIAAALKDAK